MKAYDASSTIAASPQALWAILTDAPAYSKWDSGVEKVEGSIAPREKIKVVSKANPGRAFPVKVSEFEPGRRMVWSGGMPLGLFKGVRTFTLQPGSSGDVEFSMREEYTGLMAPLIGRSIPDLQLAFDEFASDLKRAAEAV